MLQSLGVRATCLAFLLLSVAAVTPANAVNPQDGLTLHVARGTNPGTVVLSWTAGAAAPYTVYRAATGAPDAAPANALGTTDLFWWNDAPPPGGLYLYRVGAKGRLLRSAQPEYW